jgi:DNA-binding GntR family transcriptional regulator
MTTENLQPSDKLITDGGQSVAVAYAHLRRAILRGEISPGGELSQVRLARELGISRTPLREALRMLMREGLVEGAPNQSLRVAGFSIADMEELYIERVTLEAVAIRITVPRLTSEELASMEGLFAQMVHFAEEEDYDRWEVPHRALHTAFVAHAGRRITDALLQLSEHAERYRHLYTTQASGGWIAGIHEHRAIIDACKRRDPNAAARALAEHLGHVALGVIELAEPEYGATGLVTAIAVASLPLGSKR